MNDKGYIKIHRELLDKPIWAMSTPEQKAILITLLMMANHSENEWEWKGKKFVVMPGQFITSIYSIAVKSGKGISVKNVRTALERFEKYRFLANESASTGRLITVINWAKYQCDASNSGKQDGKRPANGWQTGGKRVATNNNDKNDKNDKKYIYYGEFQNVKLTEDEHLKLKNSLNGRTEEFINRLSGYVESTGKRYKSHYATILNWARKDGVIKNGEVDGGDYDFAKIHRY